MLKIRPLWLLLILLPAGLYSCEAEDPGPDLTSTSLYVKLMDKPGTYEEVNIDILVVGVIINDTLHSLYTNAGIYNLLDFTGRNDTILASKSVPVGYLSQIRLVLGDNNTVKKDGIEYELKAPSASESGLKLNIHQELLPEIAYTFLVDFDAEKSVIKAGKKYLLKPVIHVINQDLSGSVAGIIRPVEAAPEIIARSNLDTFIVYASITTGEYLFRGLPEALYDLFFYPVEPWNDTVLYDINVKASKTTLPDTLYFK